ncbi:MAG: hypothetical protein HY313_10060 [Acidobacteria bacterium]|nr:hypothetical protein [Acidobacteriota bacterium]
MAAKKVKAKAGSAPRKKNTRLWQAVLGMIVVAAVASAYFLVSQNSSSGGETRSASSAETESASGSSLLQNRLILPAQPRSIRPVTLSPNSFSDPDVQRAYQAAKEVPEVLEHMACYCGCYGNSGHRNNLDCFADNHGVT